MRRGDDLVLAVEVVDAGVEAQVLDRRTAEEDRLELAKVDALAEREEAQSRRLAQRALEAGLRSQSRTARDRRTSRNSADPRVANE